MAGKTILEEDRETLDLYEQFSLEEKCERSPWVVRLQLDPAKLVQRNLLDMTQIQARLESQTETMPFKFRCTMITTEQQMAVRFEGDAGTIESLRRMEDQLLDLVISGNPNIGNI